MDFPTAHSVKSDNITENNKIIREMINDFENKKKEKLLELYPVVYDKLINCIKDDIIDMSKFCDYICYNYTTNKGVNYDCIFSSSLNFKIYKIIEDYENNWIPSDYKLQLQFNSMILTTFKQGQFLYNKENANKLEKYISCDVFCKEHLKKLIIDIDSFLKIKGYNVQRQSNIINGEYTGTMTLSWK
jgi:hypothetical protein